MNRMLKDAGNQSIFWAGFGTFWAAYSLEQKLAILGLIIGAVSGLVNMYAKCSEGRSREKRDEREAKHADELHQMEIEKRRLEIAKLRGQQ